MDAPEPFNASTDPNSIILRSSDGVNFHVPKLHLSSDPSFFSEMFELPQPPDADPLPIINATEDQHTLDMVLRVLHPNIAYKIPQNVTDIRSVLEAAKKYRLAAVSLAGEQALVLLVNASPLQNAAGVLGTAKAYELPSVTTAVEQALISRAKDKPLEVYAVACRCGLQEAAAAAAKAARHIPLKSLLEERDELRHISIVAFQRLLLYHQECMAEASMCSQEFQAFPFGFWQNSHRKDTGCEKHYAEDRNGRGSHFQPWWVNFMRSLEQKLLVRMWNEAETKAEFMAAWRRDCPCEQCLQPTANRTKDVDALMQSMSKKIQERQDRVSTGYTTTAL